MFSNSEEALATLHNQLTKERSLLQEDVVLLKDHFPGSNDFSQKGQLLLGSSPKNNNGFHYKEEEPRIILLRIEQKLIELKNSTSIALCSWEELRNAELKKLQGLCEMFERLSHTKENTENLTRLEKKIDSLFHEDAHHRSLNEFSYIPTTHDYKQPDTAHYAPVREIHSDEPKESLFTSLLLYGESL